MQGSRRVPLELRRPSAVFATVALATLALDQITKLLVRSYVPVGSLRPLIPAFIDLTHVRNMGAAFGLLPGRQPIFVATSLVVLIVIGAYWRRDRPVVWPVVVGIAFVAGGAVGNLIDRVLLTKVTDFLSFAFMDFPVFNVADMGIVSGVTLLVLWLLFGPEPENAGRRAAIDESSEVCSQEGDDAGPHIVDELAADRPIAEGTD